jgi:hypothetical protein
VVYLVRISKEVKEEILSKVKAGAGWLMYPRIMV